MDFPTTYYTVEDQKNWQTTVPTWSIATPRTPPKGGLRYHSGNDSGHGAGACVVSTDLGQPTGLYPDEGMEAFATALYQDGFTAEQVRQMTVYNQRKLLGKD